MGGRHPGSRGPGYLKNNSHGEFVFDHAWAHAYERYGQEYFPKWLCGVPYSPVTGPRLLGAPKWRGHLLAAMRELVERSGLSSAHVNFYPANEDAGFDADWLERNDLQYHWHNVSGWNDFETFLSAMDHKHRKNIRQERAKVQRAGVQLRVVHGDEASDADLDAMYGFYLKTFNEYGNSPALTPQFLQHLATAMPRQLVMFLAELEGTPSPARYACADRTRCTAAIGADKRCPACISRPAITRASNIACAKA